MTDIMNLDPILNVVKESSSKFIREMSELEPEAWEIPSRCHQWAIKDICSHTLAIDGFFLNSITRSIAGDGNPSEGMPNPGTGNAQSMAPGIASRAIQISETAFPDVKQLLSTMTNMESNLIEVFQNLSPQNWHIPAYHPAGQFSPYLFLKMKLMEIVIHSWDIFSSIDPSYQIRNDEAQLLSEVWKESKITSWFYTPDQEQTEPVTIDFNFDDNQCLRVQTWRGTLNIFEQPFKKITPPVTTVETTYQDFALMVTARKNIHEAYNINEISVSGDISTLEDFHKLFRGS